MYSHNTARLSGHIVTILAGSPPTEFRVHANVLKECDSLFFKAAFQNGFQETETGQLVLPEDDADGVALVLDWMYSPVHCGCKCCEADIFGNKETGTILKLYVLASKYIISSLHDALITCTVYRLFDEVETQPTLTKEDLEYYADNTMAGCKMDTALAEWAVETVRKAARYTREPDPLDHQLNILDILPERCVRAALKILAKEGIQSPTSTEFRGMRTRSSSPR